MDEMRTKLVQVWLDSRKEPRQCRPMAAIVNAMWTTHTEIFRNKTYIQHCYYPAIVQLKNRGKQRAKKATHPKNIDQDKPI